MEGTYSLVWMVRNNVKKVNGGKSMKLTNRLKKIIGMGLGIPGFFAAQSSIVHAHCPLCTVAVGGAAVAAQYLGVDESIIGLLIGAFGISTGLWIGQKIKKQFFPLQLWAVALLSFLLTVIPLLPIVKSDAMYMPMLYFGAAGTLFNKVYWVDKVLFGSIIGGIITSAAFLLHTHIKNTRGKVLFPYQGIAFTTGMLFITGVALYFIISP